MGTTSTTLTAVNSFNLTPQATGDTFTYTEDVTGVVYLDVMANDLGGNAKTLYSLDDGLENDGTSGSDLLIKDTARAESTSSDTSAHGAKIWITSDGKVGYDSSTLSSTFRADLQGLNAGETLTDTFTYAIRLANGTLSWTTTTIVYTGVNDAPTITSSDTVTVDENTTAVLTVTSTDPDNNDTAAYSISGGADAALFDIDATTGALTFKSAPDFENPGDADHDNVYDVQVTVTDGGGLTDVQSIAVTVDNVNEAPSITSSDTASVDENTTAVLTVTASDPDAGDSATFTISGGDDAALFDIDASTGALTFKAAPNFESPGDSDGDNVYDVQVTVTDGGGLTDVQSIAVTVGNVNEAPSITSSDTATVDENTTAVLTVTSSDQDAGDTATYSISGGADAALFDIDTSTGVLTFKAAPDYENPGDSDHDNVYDVEVTVTDGGALTDVQSIAVTVGNVNEAPSITSSDTATVDENTTAVLTVTSSDPDAGDSASYSITGGADASLFQIDASTGALSFVSAPNYEAPADAGADNVYDVEVTVTDGGALTDVQSIAVTVGNVNEAPSITSSDTATVDENTTAVLTVTSSDPDAGDSASYSITGGADASLFQIDATTGALSFVSAPNYEAPADAGGDNVYDVEVTVTDGGALTDVQSIAVTVGNVNEAPSITSSDTATVDENTTAVLTVTSSDPDAGDTATYTLSGGADASLFQIDGTTGALSFVSAPNYEAPADAGADNVYDVEVTVTDGGALTDVQSIAVTVDNANEAPSITSSDTASVDENTTAVLTVTSSDPDAGDTAAYTISGGADAALFDIDASTGELTFKAAPDFENPADADANNVYDVEVTVTDGGALTDVQSIAVTVDNVNEAPSITSSDTATVAENTTAVLTVTSSDPDAGDSASYSITGGADASLFQIDASTGALSFVSAPDYENPGDSGHDNVYDVQVTVTDGGSLTDAQSIAVTVSNVAEASTPTPPPVYTGTGDPNDFDSLGNSASQNLSAAGTNGNDTLYGGGGNDTINGGGGDDTIYGGSGSDGLNGNNDGDTLYGGSGNDSITGSNGIDTIVGGYGADTLTGGSDADTFVYLDVKDTGDTVVDFVHGTDKINLSAIDANTAVANDQAFTFVAADTNAVQANSVTWHYDSGAGVTHVWVDVNGDTTADLQIDLNGSVALTSGDFIL